VVGNKPVDIDLEQQSCRLTFRGLMLKRWRKPANEIRLMRCSLWSLIMLACALAGSATLVAAQTALLALSGGAGPPGGSATTNLIFHGNGAHATGIQWTLNYSPADFRSISVATTSLATDPGEVLSCKNLSDHTNCVMVNLTSNSMVIPDGVIAVLTFKIASKTQKTFSQITLTNLRATSGSSSTLPLIGTDAAVTINQPVSPRRRRPATRGNPREN